MAAAGPAPRRPGDRDRLQRGLWLGQAGPAEHCAALARRIVDELDHDVLVLCGPSEEESAREIVRRAQRGRVVSLAGQPIGLGLSKGVIRRSCAMVSTDSGPLHVARALGKPTIALLGPTAPIWIENPTIENTVLQLPLDCSACYKRTCPLGHHRCTDAALARGDMVVAAVDQLVLSRGPEAHFTPKRSPLV